MEKEHIRRVSNVVKTLTKAGYQELVSRLHLRIHIPFLHRNHDQILKITTPVRIRRLLDKLGGAYVKLGQLLSLRPDLIPSEYSQEFKKLQDNVKPFPYHVAERIIKNELKKDVSKVFKSIKKSTLGSASIAQVHEAVLKTGEKVVVKVQRPNVKKDFDADIDVMIYLAHRMEKYLDLPFSPVEVVKEFEKHTREELDFKIEGAHINQFYKTRGKNVAIPKYYEKYSTSKILVMEKLEGLKLSEVLEKHNRINKHKIALNLFHISLKQIYTGEIFHGDLHPGNIIVMKNGKLGLIDFGISGCLNPELKEQGIRMYVALIDKDPEEVYTSMLNMSIIKKTANLSGFREEVFEIVENWQGNSLNEARITHTLHMLLNSGHKYGVNLPADMIILGKALVTLEGTALQLYPEFNFVEESKPYVVDLLKEQIRMGLTLKRLLKTSFMVKDYLRKFPKHAISTMQAIEDGKFKIDIEDTDIQYLGDSINLSSDRISLALVSASFVIAGALIVGVDIGPKSFGYPILALISFLIAFGVVVILFFVLIQKVKFKYSKKA